MNHSFYKTLIICILLPICFLIPAKLSAQWTFRAGFGSVTQTDRIGALTTDASGNVYITGSYWGAIDFGVGALPWTGALDGFVAKFSPAGVCLWSIRFNGPASSQDQGLAIATNGTSVFVGGSFQTSLSVNGAAAITGYGGFDGFGLKLNATTGATEWVTIFGGGTTEAVQAVCVDNTGNMYATGYFSSSATFPNATFGSFTRTSNGGTGTDTYVTKLDGTTGAILWVSTGGFPSSNDNVSGSGLAYVPVQDVIVMTGSAQTSGPGITGTYSTPAPATSSVTLSSQGGLDITVLKLNAATGAYQSANIVGGASNSNEEALAAAYDPSTGYVTFCGYFNTSALTFGTSTVSPYGSDDCFYTAFNPQTNAFVWARSAGSTIQDRALALAPNGTGSIFLTGRFRNTLSAPTATTPLTLTSFRTTSADEIFMLEVNSSTGYAQNLVGPQGDVSLNTGNIGYGISSRGTAVWLGGMFGGTIILPPLGSLSTSGGISADILLLRYGAAGTLPLTLLSFTANPAGNDVRLSWRTADETDHDYFDLERSTDGRTFTAIARLKGQPGGGSGSYAHTDIAAISNATGKLFYRLKMVSTTGHGVYSSTAMIDPGRMDNDVFLRNVSPNPFTGPLQANIYLKESGLLKISVADMSGRIIASSQVQVDAGASTVPVQGAENLNKGTYILTVEYKGKKSMQKVMKQ